ncbi:uncharacterized protein LOC6580981 isoform X2 [Drosophila mojavensis]|uniref:uncharacterized protein LOC6580981 isoform X2 n=1 Tax=Drosophila mojavensis TaxID=7230 RepID=UPI00017C9CC4|nr:uncharacterized protein LOC6580981 isoform X2 [Drosophila mojavensis]
MSRKRSQGSRASPTQHSAPEEEGDSTARGISASRTDAETVPSEATNLSADEGQQELPEILSAPVILVAGPSPPENEEANTDPERPRSHEPGGTEGARRGPSQSQGVQTRRSSSNSYEYDREEPLLTKRTKVYKKRGVSQNPAVDKSDDSILDVITSSHRAYNSQLVSGNDMTDFPQSEASGRGRATESSSSPMYSSSGTIILTEAELMDLDPVDFQQGNLPPHMRLESGLAFIYMAIPPDGGFGWVVLILSFLAQLIVDGIIFSIGILLPAMEKDFKVSTSAVALVASIQIGCYFMGGAFSSALINSYGFRPVAMLGVAISTLALLGASFSPNLTVMILVYGIVGGPGLSMIWVSSQLIIGFYFERYRALASGFSCSGAGAGILIFSITNNLMEQQIGWRNTVRCHAFLVCLLIFVSMAYLEVKPSPVGVVHRFPEISSTSSEYYGNFYVHNFLSEDLSMKRSHPVLDTFEPNKKKETKRKRCRNLICPCCAKRDHDDDKSMRSEVNYLVRPDPMQRDDLFYTGPIDYDEPHRREQFDGKELELVGTETHLQSAAYGLHNIHNYDSTDMSEWVSVSDGYVEHRPVIHKRAATPVSTQHKRHVSYKSRCWIHQKIIKAMNRLFDMHLLKSYEFRVLLASAFLYPMGFNIPFLYSKMRTTVPNQYAQMIGPAIGTSNFIVRILCGFVAYKLRNWTNYICGGGMVLGGIAVLVSAFFGSDLVWFQVLYGLCYGVAPAVYATLRALIYVRYLGLSKLTTAFGITALVMGVGVFLGTTLGSVMVETTGGFMAAFAFAGLCIIMSGMLKLILPVLIKSRNNRLKKKAVYV